MTTPLAAIFESDMFFSSFEEIFSFFLLFSAQHEGESEKSERKRATGKKGNTRKGKRPNTVREPGHLKEAKQQSAPRQARGQMGHQKRAAGTNVDERGGC